MSLDSQTRDMHTLEALTASDLKNICRPQPEAGPPLSSPGMARWFHRFIVIGGGILLS
jgi:hypothetical protein